MVPQQLIAFKLRILITLFLSAVTVNSSKDTSYDYLEHSSYQTHQRSVSLTAQSTAFHHEASVVTAFFPCIALICLLRLIYEISCQGTSVVKAEGGEESKTISLTMCVFVETWMLEWIRKNFSVEWFVFFLLLLLFLHIIPLFLSKLLWRMGIVEKAVAPNAVPWRARAYNCRKWPCVKTMSATGTPEICLNVVSFDFKRGAQFCRVQF